MKGKKTFNARWFLIPAAAIALAAGCAKSSVNYSSGNLSMLGSFFAPASARMLDNADLVENPPAVLDHETENYRAILDQQFEFRPPVRVLVIIPETRYGWWDYYEPPHSDGFKARLFNTLADRASGSGYIREMKLGSSLFSFSTIDNLLALAARYRADECLLLSFNLYVYQPSFCLGFWPASYSIGSLTSQTMLIDTRTGFFLTGKAYAFERRSGTTVMLNLNRSEELMRLLIADLADSVVADLNEFYRKESE